MWLISLTRPCAPDDETLLATDGPLRCSMWGLSC